MLYLKRKPQAPTTELNRLEIILRCVTEFTYYLHINQKLTFYFKIIICLLLSVCVSMGSYYCVCPSWLWVPPSGGDKSLCTNHCEALVSTVYTWQVVSCTNTCIQYITLLCSQKHGIRTFKKAPVHMTLDLSKDWEHSVLSLPLKS